MRLSQCPRPGPLTTALSIFLLNRFAAAVPYPKDDLHDTLGFGFLMDRGCVQYCGYNNMYCCGSDQQCYTSNGIAGCSNTAAGGGYALYTTTWTETETFTSTISSNFPAATTTAASGTCVPEAGSGQIACGSICCASWQYCAWEGQCYSNAAGGGTGVATYTTVITTGGTTITTQYSAPYRVTSGASATQTSTATGTIASATSTGNGTVTAGGTSAHLSGGAIAGIVIGVIAGVLLLLLLCFCCIVRGLWHTVLAIFGVGKKRRGSRETIIEEERYTRHGSVHSRRDAHAGWFGRGGRPSTVAESRRTEKKKSSGAGWLGLGAAAATLLLLLGFRRDKKRRAAKTRSDVSSSYFSDSYTADSPSSGGSHRTRDTRRSSRRTETTRISRASRR
ncbi:hypothetical protein NKR23_g8891 [Pleurostoma richardsiae]|uniref:Uncharacterized protein n=1 Tax=Pleurostoma richardsiae TaxID=41990 RepID=A0AA38RH82_9PEZI|nr:hypothetical protein NKR23_g8891 [Pleurostoma richardsiae]